ncbi:hexosaminidase [Chitinophaga jiangningensis]|uniref:beta-N-acetylhexosaminidase n=1 Tax=Chitinophaga jiangningensis TaxID=1419482 RepID=A0A1M7KFP6_9BACT|nr:beta-N-acetylhexosaminidase [Chitinophaga jiangningensis]SHM64094.1 hexosaminidase [Chitinophaga jiangningensis]
MQTIFQRLAALSILLGATIQLYAVNIIPMPAEVKENGTIFTLSPSTTISGNSPAEAAYLQAALEQTTGLHLPTNGKGQTNNIRLEVNSKLLTQLGQEGYTLHSDAKGVLIRAATAGGVFYGVQSMRQLVATNGNVHTITGVDITDKPRFGWRSFMLDEARHFQGTAAVKQLLEEMSVLKMNTFHWHLTDDQGWRIEIKKYPLLAQVGSHRDSSQTAFNSKVYRVVKHEGFYTQEQIRDIIQYAAARHITIVPEIEMPGHASAAIAAYPWLGTRHEQIAVPAQFGVHYNVFNVTDPKVITFLQDVLQEVMGLFPSRVIHIGGDEVKYDQWKADSGVVRYMRAHQLNSPADLQIAFTNSISNFLAGRNRRMMGWNEIMGIKLHEYNDAKDVAGKEKLAPGTIVQFWKGDLSLIRDAVSKGYDVVNSYHSFTYLDYDFKLDKAYSFDPVPNGLESQYENKILGSGCQMWGEFLPDVKTMTSRVFPRLAAYAEAGWTSTGNKDYERFKKGLPFFYERWEKAGIIFQRQ